ncbi:MAG: SsrA-binding protein SmpB [bacterium]|nr:SsrA-binding protein SmpB [bacterium]
MQIYATNEKARFNYEILETLEGGFVLTGQEVKSVRRGSASIKGAYVKILGGEAWLLGATIPPYQAGNTPPGYDSLRSRKLLLKRSELKYLAGKSLERGLTLVPIKLYNKNGLIKLEIGIGRGKKKSDKREKIVKREVKRNIERALKQSAIHQKFS